MIYGGLLGLIGTGLSLAVSSLWLAGRGAPAHKIDLSCYVIQCHAVGQVLTTFVLPTSVCGAIVWFLLVPRLIFDRTDEEQGPGPRPIDFL